MPMIPPYTVWIDDDRVALLRWGQEIVIPVAAGARQVQLRSGWGGAFGLSSERLFFQVEPQQEIRIECTTTGDQIHLRRLVDPAAPGSTTGGAARVLGLRESTRIEEWLGEDVRLIDNRSSPAPVTRTLKASREWTRTLTVGASHGRTVHGDVNLNLLWLSAKASIETELQQTSSLAIGSTHLFEEEISVTVPDRTAVQIVLGWKRIWQCGDAQMMLPDGSTHIVPFQVVVSVTFDQRIQEATNLPNA